MKFIAMLGLIFHLVLMQLVVFAQPVDDAAITRLITEFKKDVRGPYQAIRWFCPDGRVLPPQERCNQPGAIQHALPKNIVQKIAEERGIWLGQILAGTPAEAFLDAEHLFSRAKQYQIEQYLTRIDDGWILRRARYYRGAIQAEDEAAWSAQFLSKQLADTQMIAEQFFCSGNGQKIYRKKAAATDGTISARCRWCSAIPFRHSWICESNCTGSRNPAMCNASKISGISIATSSNPTC